MLGRNKIKKVIDEALSYSTAEETQVSLFIWDSFLTRFANSYIHQNMGEGNIQLEIRVINDKRVGESTTNRIDSEAIKKAVVTACEISKFTEPIQELVPLPGPKKYLEVNSFYENTNSFTPVDRANVVKEIIDEAAGFSTYGSFPTSTLEIALGNSKGLFSYNLSTAASIVYVVMSNIASSYGSTGSRNVEEIDYQIFAREIVKKVKMQKDLNSIKPGEYDVILEPLAVTDMLMFLGWLGFGALAFQEDRSFMSGRIGEKIMGDNITIWDDGLSKEGMPFPFDFEGIPKKKVVLIEKGVAKGVVYDRRTAAKEGKESTGHSIGSSAYGPYPMNLFIKGGKDNIDKMIKETKKGIYVTRFHYTNPIDPITASITGMTRDGTFLIEDGRITKPLYNLRFTQSLIKALCRVTHLSPSVLVPEVESYDVPFYTGSKVPAMRIEAWNFTGVSKL
ncbi:TldD/PmbA family protein [candidate division WOR-3 bacterium]|nr:TldD/PmbA family protein [candidate division WOR-3 bacterium]